MANVGTVVITLDANTAKLIDGVKKSQKQLSELQRTTKKAKDTITNFIKAAVGFYAVTKAVETAKDAFTSFVSTSAQFEQFETTLKSIEGSSEKARESMQWIKDFTSQTPYQLAQVTESFVKLRAYGLTPTDGLLKTLGDTASAMGKPVMQAVEAIADAVTGENERLKEFGIKASKQGEDIAYAWTDSSGSARDIIIDNNKEIIQSTLEAIFNERYAGAMEEQSKTWNGIVSNIQDSWTMFKDNIMSAGLFEYLKAMAMTVKDYLGSMFGEGTEGAKSFSDKVISGVKSVISALGFLSDVVDGIKLGFKAVEYAVLFMSKAVMQAINLPIDTLNYMIDLYNRVVDKLGGEPIQVKVQPFIDTTWTDNTMAELKQEMGDLVDSIANDSGAKNAAKLLGDIDANLKKLNETQADSNQIKDEANAKLTQLGATYVNTSNDMKEAAVVYELELKSLGFGYTALSDEIGQATSAEIDKIYADEIAQATASVLADTNDAVSTTLEVQTREFSRASSFVDDYTESINNAAKAVFSFTGNQVESYTRIISASQAWWDSLNPLSNLSGTTFDIFGTLGTTSMPGYASGGYTGNIATDAIAGVVHGGEYVINAETTNELGLNGSGGVFQSMQSKLSHLPEVNKTLKFILKKLTDQNNVLEDKL